MNRFRDDLGAAGIPYVDGKGEYADFHALRRKKWRVLWSFKELTHAARRH